MHPSSPDVLVESYTKPLYWLGVGWLVFRVSSKSNINLLHLVKRVEGKPRILNYNFHKVILNTLIEAI